MCGYDSGWVVGEGGMEKSNYEQMRTVKLHLYPGSTMTQTNQSEGKNEK